MKVFILTEGGKDIGFGHLARCLALGQGFKDVCPEAEVNFLINGDRHARDFLKINGCAKGIIFFDWRNDADKSLAMLKRSDAVIIDSYLAPAKFYRRIYNLEPRPYVAVIDDYNRMEYCADAVINPSVCSFPYKKRAGIGYLTGPDYVILRKELRAPVKKIIRKEIHDVLVTFGGMGYAGLMSKVASHLAKYALNLYVVNPRKKALRPQELRSLMQKADLCISAGGQTTNELARAGVPTIGICVSDNQLHNLRCWEKNGFIEYIGRHTDKTLLNNLDMAIRRLLPYKARLEKSRAGIHMIDGRGTQRIAKFIIGKSAACAFALKLAGEKDILDLWKWRNHQKVRRWCFNKDKISLISHRKWFSRVMKDPMVKMYIAWVGRHKAGVIRFDKAKECILVNINLNPHFMGRGLGAELIKAGTRKFREESGTRKPVVAKIMKENCASLKAFAKAGYRPYRKHAGPGYLTYVYN